MLWTADHRGPAPPMSEGAAAFGPWAPGLDRAERLARLRAMRALVRVLVAPHTALGDALLAAESDPAGAERALAELDALPPLRRRRRLSTYAALATAARREGRSA
ncbi:MAG: hypothetical protein ACREFQ_10740 [Stellaceae bacterium]